MDNIINNNINNDVFLSISLIHKIFEFIDNDFVKGAVMKID